MSEWQPDFLTAGTGLSVWFAQENKAKVLGFYDLSSQVIQSHCHPIRFVARHKGLPGCIGRRQAHHTGRGI